MVVPFVIVGRYLIITICVAYTHYLFPSLQILIPTYSLVLDETFLVIIFVMVFQIVGQQVVVVLVDALAHFQSVHFFRIVNEVVVLESECAYTKSQKQGGYKQFL